MASKRTLDATLDRLRALEDAPMSEALQGELKKLLGSARGIVAGKAAKLAGEKKMVALVPELVRVFERFMENPVKTDPGCRAKCGAVEALAALQADQRELFARGLRHVQKEPAWGPPVDTADRLRGLCAFALYAIGDPRLFFRLVDLLQDPEPIARIAAIQVLGNLESETSELLLRMKAREGDPEPEVLGECLGALMRIAPRESLPFVAEFLNHGGEAGTEAGFALGESRLPEACETLIEAHHSRVGPSGDALLLPIALTRRDAALDYLLTIIAESSPAAAEAALKALATQPVTAGQLDRITTAVRGRKNPALDAVLREEFQSR